VLTSAAVVGAEDPAAFDEPTREPARPALRGGHKV
jgi:hypothetical protein